MLSMNPLNHALLAGSVTTIAGVPGRLGDISGAGAGAKFSSPSLLVCQPDGSLMVWEGGLKVMKHVTCEKGCSRAPDPPTSGKGEFDEVVLDRFELKLIVRSA